MGERRIAAGLRPTGPSFITGVGRLELGIPVLRLAQALRARSALPLTNILGFPPRYIKAVSSRATAALVGFCNRAAAHASGRFPPQAPIPTPTFAMPCDGAAMLMLPLLCRIGAKRSRRFGRRKSICIVKLHADRLRRLRPECLQHLHLAQQVSTPLG